jgi:cathepsin F
MKSNNKVAICVFLIFNLGFIVCQAGVPGGINPTTDAETINTVKQHAKTALSKVTLGDQSCELVDVEDVGTQVVAGINYSADVSYKCGSTTNKCKLTIWEQRWNNLLNFYWKCPELKKFSSERRRKRSLIGGHRELPEAEIKSLETMVIDALNDASNRNPNKNYHLVKITSATKQVVSGYSYNFEVDAKDDNGDAVHCSVRIHVQKWKNSGNDIKMTCDEETFKFHQVPHHEHHHDHHSFTSKGEDHMNKLFQKFMSRHKRQYTTSSELQIRFEIFKENLYKIEQLNRNEEGTAKYGITEFADMNTQEFKRYTGFIPREKHENEVKNPMADILDIDLPASFDWRERGVVSEVKNQGQCGSCWAFSVTGNIEGQHAIKYGKLEEYSEQELVDCDTTDNGCGGGYMDDAYKAIEKIGGLELENDYPYEGSRDKCQFNSTNVHVKVKGAVDLPKNETSIAQFLVQNGPISIALNANAMQFYRGGVSKPIKFLCNPKGLDHGVLIVGYGTAEYPRFKKVLPYWIIKNSWGKRWGEQGYYRLYRGDDRCGVANMASSAVIE